MNQTGPFLTKMIDAQSADETQAAPVLCLGYTYLSAVVQGTGTTSSGVLTIEQAAYDGNKEPAYGGTWSTITTLNASDVTGGAQKFYQFTPAAYGWVRLRISTVIGGGGTVSVYLLGQ